MRDGSALRTPHSALAFPDLSNQPAAFTIRTGAEGLKQFTDRLARLEVLQPAHWNGDCADACTRALTDYATAARPTALANLSLSFTDYADLGEGDSYEWKNKLRERMTRRGPEIAQAHEPPGAFVVCMDTIMDNGPYHQVIGPVLERLEKLRPRLGQTVLFALQRGLNLTCRALTPRNGIHWASHCYWMGEDDESMRAAEELDELMTHYEHDKPKRPDGTLVPPPTLDDCGVFRKKDYEKAFPEWRGLGRIQPLSLASLRRTQLSTRWPSAKTLQPILAATAALLARCLHPGDVENDCGGFEETSWDMVPYLLRWSDDGDKDPLVQIWDDMMNDYSQGGDVAMHINSVFAFHDDRSFRRALVRLRNFLQILHLTENLLRAMALKEELVINT